MALLGDGGTLKYGPNEKRLGHWGHALKGEYGTPYHPLFSQGVGSCEVNGRLAPGALPHSVL